MNRQVTLVIVEVVAAKNRSANGEARHKMSSQPHHAKHHNNNNRRGGRFPSRGHRQPYGRRNDIKSNRDHNDDEADDHVPENYLALIRSIGNTPEDIEKWRAERRRRFPRTAVGTIEATATAAQSAPAVGFLGDYFAAYASDEEDASTPPNQVEEAVVAVTETNEGIRDSSEPEAQQKKLCPYFDRNGHCRYGDRCRNAHLAMSASKSEATYDRNKSQLRLRTRKELAEALLAPVSLAGLHVGGNY